MAKSVNECGAKYLILKDFLPSGEREVCGDDGGFFPSSEREVVEKHLSAFLVKADKSMASISFIMSTSFPDCSCHWSFPA